MGHESVVREGEGHGQRRPACGRTFQAEHPTAAGGNLRTISQATALSSIRASGGNAAHTADPVVTDDQDERVRCVLHLHSYRRRRAMGVGIEQGVVEDEQGRPLHGFIVSRHRTGAANLKGCRTVGIGNGEARHRIGHAPLEIVGEGRRTHGTMELNNDLKQPVDLDKGLLQPLPSLPTLLRRLSLEHAALRGDHVRFQAGMLYHAYLIEDRLPPPCFAQAEERPLPALCCALLMVDDRANNEEAECPDRDSGEDATGERSDTIAIAGQKYGRKAGT